MPRLFLRKPRRSPQGRYSMIRIGCAMQMRKALKVNYLLGSLCFCSLKQSIKISLKQGVFSALFEDWVSLRNIQYKVETLINNCSISPGDIHDHLTHLHSSSDSTTQWFSCLFFFLETFHIMGYPFINLKEYVTTIALSSRKTSCLRFCN